MKVSIIAAVARNGVIGKANALPWRIDDDMRFFLSMTTGHFVITGRRNFDAMGKALPNRFNIVVTRDAGFAAPNVVRCHSIERALALSEQGGETEAFVIGGAQIYAAALPYVHTMYLTRVLADIPGDVRFPEFDTSEWYVSERARHEANATNEHAFLIEEHTRKSAPAEYR
jgi:dihydrofolate reductase